MNRFKLVLAAWILLAGCRSAGVVPKPGPPVAAVLTAELDVTLYLIGDAGEPDPAGGDQDPVLAELERQLRAGDPARAVVVFLGDNLYPDGLPEKDPGGKKARKLDAQLAVFQDPAVRGIFVAGNHDWGAGKEGLHNLDRQQQYIARRAGEQGLDLSLVPASGCPGPVVEDRGQTLRLVLLDTQWWLQSMPPARFYEGRDCEGFSDTAAQQVLAELDRGLAGAAGRHVVVVGHHPLATGGPHGKDYWDWTSLIFPFQKSFSGRWIPCPIACAAYPLARRYGFSSQDEAGGKNRRLRAALEDVFERHPPLVYGAGHDHTLQVLNGRHTPTLLVSGAGSFDHLSPIKPLPGTRFAPNRGSGFMRLDFLNSGAVRLGVTVLRQGSVAEEYSECLAGSCG